MILRSTMVLGTTVGEDDSSGEMSHVTARRIILSPTVVCCRFFRYICAFKFLFIMGFLTFLEVLLEIGLLVLAIKFLVKFWKLCDDVSVIRKLREGEIRSSVNSCASSSTVQSDSNSGSSPKSVPVVNQATPDSWRRLNSLKMYDDVRINGIICSYHGEQKGLHVFYPYSNQDLSGQDHLSKDSVGNVCFMLEDEDAAAMIGK